MANFTPVRYSGTPTKPVLDGQMLVDRDTGLVAFDIGTSRVRPNNIYGITAYISDSQWSNYDGKAEINLNTLEGINIPAGYNIVGASLLTGQLFTQVYKNSALYIVSDTPSTGLILLFCLPGSLGYTDDTIMVDNNSTYALDNEDRTWELADTTVPEAITVSGDVFVMEDNNATGGDRIWSL